MIHNLCIWKMSQSIKNFLSVVSDVTIDVVENDIKQIFGKMGHNPTLNLDTDYGYHDKNPSNGY